MTDRKRMIVGVVILFTLLCMAPMAMAQSEDVNILIQFRMGTIDGTTRTVMKSYNLIVASGSSGSSLLAGKRVPFPTLDNGLAAGSDDGTAPARPIVYQNIGFATTAEALVIDGNKIRFRAEMENSKIVEGAVDGLPVVETRQVTINAVLTDGEPLEVTRAEGLLDQPGFVEVEVSILR